MNKEPDLLTTKKLLLTLREVSEMLSLPETTVSYLHRMGRLKGHLLTRTLRWKYQDVCDFVDRLK